MSTNHAGQRPVFVSDEDPLPPSSMALGPTSAAPGLLAVGGSVHPKRLREAYRRGIFPWYSPGEPVCWWAPDPRMVLDVTQFKLAPSLRKTIKRFLRTPGCDIRFDHDFARVMACCAGVPRHGQHGTWIVPAMLQAYGDWHRQDLAPHSVEVWVDDQLVGGLYGVNLGRMMFGESMFSLRTDASKIALAALVAFCRAQGMAHIDCQQHTAHLASMGARDMPRATFEAHVAAAVDAPAPTWAYDVAHWSCLDPKLL